MILIDTSVWIAHLRNQTDALDALLYQEQVLVHPFVIGELACGNLKNRREILSAMAKLPAAVVATHQEVLELIEARRLMGKGLGYLDLHLLASAVLNRCFLWTLDKRLHEIGQTFGIAYVR